MQLDRITPLILTYNEDLNISRTLDTLRWAKRIIVIDSYSTDATLDILSHYPSVTLYQHPFESFAGQCNFGLTCISTEWTLSLDADYQVSAAFITEIQSLTETITSDGFKVALRYCVFGYPLRSTLLPPRTVLYRTAKAHYIEDGHAHRVRIDGPVASLRGPINHDDRKPLSHWLWAQNRYMVLEVQKLSTTPGHELSLADKIRKTKILAPFVVLFYCLILKGGILDGWHGWYYALQRVLVEMLLAIHLIEADLKPTEKI
ncbi:glycosyltransferase family 2 protein [Leptolyngbya sp. KIOST-1]|uniref:glycosyltransferase family 2 protein n=1 Tax=Leptolyngbya sp. KIOST-1 TaxID=1229172 RepID=UPI0005649E12|nr:glycosyltransferase family 2 protein [Leptolyngbya sp. KIOST-1]